MRLTELFLAQLDAEARRTRRAVEHVPEGRDDWKPHEKSMPLGRLTLLVAGMPSWLAMMIRDRAERLSALDDGVAQARAALTATTDEHLMKPWRLLVAGKVVSEEPRHVVLRDTFMHLSHHRGQLTVYLRLNDVTVPAIYGPSADESRFD